MLQGQIETQYKERAQQVFLDFLPPNVKHVTITDVQNLFFCDWSRRALEFGAAKGIVEYLPPLPSLAPHTSKESSPAKSGKQSAKKSARDAKPKQPAPLVLPGPPINLSRLYDEMSDVKVMHAYVESQLEDYNLLSKAPMDIVVFRFLIDHVIRICRVVKQPNGHALLLGRLSLFEFQKWKIYEK